MEESVVKIQNLVFVEALKEELGKRERGGGLKRVLRKQDIEMSE